MPRRRLSSELVALIHHVELTDAGWRDRLAEQLVLAQLVLSDRPVDMPEVVRAARAQAGDSLDESAVQRAIVRLQGARTVVQVGTDSIKLSEAAMQDAKARMDDMLALAARAKAHFLATLRAELPSIEDGEWDRFCSQCLDPIVGELGARTYDLISGSLPSAQDSRAFITYIEGFPIAQRPMAQRGVSAFLDPRHDDVRRFLLQRLHSYLLTLAATLNDSTLEAIRQSLSGRVQLRIFVDTNFLFSLLDLHENPANEAAVELVRLLRGLAGRLKVQLYVFPLTVDEVRRTLAYHEGRLSGMPLTARLGRAAAASGQVLSGIAAKYISAVQASKQRLSATQYFEPYVANLLAVLRSRQIELFNEDVDSLTTEQRVIDDIVDQQRFEDRRYGPRAKSYEALRHDVALWHFVHDKRVPRLDSPIDAGYWVVSVDYRLLGFSFHKQRTRNEPVPVCIHPAVLIQMLQLWMPRNAELEAAMLQSIRALVPLQFDHEAEEVTIRILRSLSRYEDVDDLSEETIANVLMDRALRSRMKDVEDVDEQVSLVREAIVAELTETRAELQRERERKAELEQKLADLADGRLSDRVASEQTLEHERKQLMEVSERLAGETARADDLADRVAGLEKWIEHSRAEQSLAKLRTHAVISWVGFAFFGISTAALLAWGVHAGHTWVGAQLHFSSFKAQLSLGAPACLIWLATMEGVGSAITPVASTGAFRFVSRVRKWLYGICGAIAVSLLASYLWELR